MNTSIIIGDIQKAVAKECRYLGDASRDTINIITKLYLKQLKKDGFTVTAKKCRYWRDTSKEKFFIDHED